MASNSIDATDASFKYTVKAHPTLYNGVMFRSRLEARWAAFFDLVFWKWEYEPLDLPGWVPDFILEKSIAVEVKPIFRIEDFPTVEISKISASTWSGPVLIMGAAPPACDDYYDSPVCWTLPGREGGFSVFSAKRSSLGGALTAGYAFEKSLGKFELWDDRAFEHSGTFASYSNVIRLWAQAGNITQWRP